MADIASMSKMKNVSVTGVGLTENEAKKDYENVQKCKDQVISNIEIEVHLFSIYFPSIFFQTSSK